GDDRDPDLPSASWPLGDDRDPDLPSASWPLGDGAPTARLSGRQTSTSPTGADRTSSQGDASADERPHAL
ncbi:hypothetical protein, partial [Kitasatospora indigofera]|uniref:hypothetical protein n=1 Tax=Kitasatospora indigofera TaxID=67307 RepID=UPI0036A75D27